MLIEPGDVFFFDDLAPAGYVRLGYQSIGAPQIEPGIRILGEVIDSLARHRTLARRA